MPSCSSPPEVYVLGLLFDSIKGLSCIPSLELMGCESHQPELRWSAKGQSETYLPSQFLVYLLLPQSLRSFCSPSNARP